VQYGARANETAIRSQLQSLAVLAAVTTTPTTDTEPAFSPDGTRVVTASDDHTARVRELPIDSGSVDDWKRRARCGVFTLDGGLLTDNHSPCP